MPAAHNNMPPRGARPDREVPLTPPRGRVILPPGGPYPAPPVRYAATMPDDEFQKLLSFLERLPAIDLPAGRKSIGRGVFENGNWWLKFSLDTTHPLAWRHVQELGSVLNYVSVEERLPTVFMPVSPPPYMNGGVEFLSWVIESTDPTFSPDLCAGWLEGRLPHPVNDLSQWEIGHSDEEHE